MKPVIVLDPGHGGQDPGARGDPGLFPWLKESDIVLDVAHRLRRLLEPYCQIVMTREDDTFISLSDRARLTNKFPGSYFLSLHCNSADLPARGFEVFTAPGQTKSDPFATALFRAYAAEFPNLTTRTDVSDGDPDKEARFTVLTATNGPAALFELEFIHTKFGHDFFTATDNLDRIAHALFNGIATHLGLAGGGPDAPLPSHEPDDLDPQTGNIAAVRECLKKALALLG